MATFDVGEEFINVSPEAPSRPSRMTPVRQANLNLSTPLGLEGLAAAGANAVAFRETIELLQRGGGGYIYFTPGWYLIGRPRAALPAGLRRDLLSDIVVPPEVTLWFAPGAVLVPLGNERPRDGLAQVQDAARVHIEIQGDILAGIQQIFEVVIPSGSQTLPAGKILLTGHRIREVHPEWWGAETTAKNTESFTFARKTTLALQAALDAACNDRLAPRPLHTGRPRRPYASIPVVLRGRYPIDATLHVGVAPSDVGRVATTDSTTLPVSTGGFELRGETGVGLSSLQAVQPFGATPREEPLLAIRGPVSVAVRDVGFFAALNIGRCVTVEPVEAEWGYCSFDGCAFADCTRELVRLDAEALRRVPPPAQGRPAPAWGTKQDFWNITFTRCSFAPVNKVNDASLLTLVLPDGTLVRPRVPDEEGNLVGVFARLGDNEGLEFRSCFIAQVASPAIRAVSGRFALNECNFHVFRPRTLNGSPFTQNLHTRNDFMHGTDVYLDAPVQGGRVPNRVVPATFTAREVESHSVQFLTMPRLEGGVDPRAFPRSAVILINVVSTHERRDDEAIFFDGGWDAVRDPRDGTVRREFPMLYDGPQTEPAAIYWAHAGQLGCPLVMIGCTLAGAPAFTAAIPRTATAERWQGLNRRFAWYASGVQGDIYDVASEVAAPMAGQSSGRSIFPENRGTRTPRVLRLAAHDVITGLPVRGVRG